MTTPINPAAVSLFGKDNWYFVTTVASASFIPTAAEVNAASSLDVTDMLFADTGQPTQATNRVTQERRYGTTTQAEFVGASTFTGGELHYQHSPQAVAGSDGKKAFEKLGGTSGTTGYLVQRQGIAKATTPATGQFVNCYPVQVGPSFPAPAGSGEAAEAGMVATFAVTSTTPAINVALT